MTEIEERLIKLEARIAGLEDQVAIATLVASYGPAADGGAAAAAAALWVEDGSYDAGIVKFASSAEIEAMLSTDPHQQFLRDGVAHIVSAPYITVDGDHATVLSYQQVVFRDADADGYRTWRTSANRWDLVRKPEGWRIARRVNRALDGSAEARKIFGDALAAVAAGPTA